MNLERIGSSAITLVSRVQWGSEILPSRPKLMDLNWPVDYVFIHHTALAQCTDQEACSKMVRSIQRLHIYDRGWDDIGYSFLIGGDGRVYEGRGWGRIGAHTYMYNSVSYGISFLGNFTDELPTEAMVEAAKTVISWGVEKGYVKKDFGLYGHRDSRCTECPGDAFYQTLQSWDRWHCRGKLQVYC